MRQEMLTTFIRNSARGHEDSEPRASSGRQPVIALTGVVVGALLSLACCVGLIWLYWHTTIPASVLTDRPLSWPSLVIVGTTGALLALVFPSRRFFGVSVIVGAALWSFATVAADLIQDGGILRQIGVL
jgi:hypothetical protein